MSFHRLLEERIVDGRLRPADSLIDYRGPPAAWFEPMDAAEHRVWLGLFGPEPLRSAA